MVNSIPSAAAEFSGIERNYKGFEEGDTSLQSGEPLPFLPHTHSQFLHNKSEVYIFNFRADKGDKIHLRVTVTRLPSVEVVLIPKTELDDYKNKSYTDVEKIEEASSLQTKEVIAHPKIPEDGEYSLVISSHDYRVTRFEMIIGKGPFSSIIVRTGGYLEFFMISAGIAVSAGGIYYLYTRKMKNGYLYEEEKDEKVYDTTEGKEEKKKLEEAGDEEVDQEEDILQYDN